MHHDKNESESAISCVQDLQTIPTATHEHASGEIRYQLAFGGCALASMCQMKFTPSPFPLTGILLDRSTSRSDNEFDVCFNLQHVISQGLMTAPSRMKSHQEAHSVFTYPQAGSSQPSPSSRSSGSLLHSPSHVVPAFNGSAFIPFLHNGDCALGKVSNGIASDLAVASSSHTHDMFCRERDVFREPAGLINESPLAYCYCTCASMPVLGGEMGLCTMRA
jgi:hypothetical protein